MIYLISNQHQLFENELYKLASVQESLIYLNSLDEVDVDTETTGLDCFIDDIFLLQLGDYNNQYLIDTTTINILEYKKLLETKQINLQNAKFDLQFFYIYGIIPTKIYDTMLAEQVLNNIYDPVLQKPIKIESNLAFLVNKYVDGSIELDKSFRCGIGSLGLTDKVIEYSAKDIKYLSIIKEKQLFIANKEQVQVAVKLENDFVGVLAYIEFCGMYLDRNKWIEKYKSAHIELQKQIKLLEEYTVKHYPKYIDKQLDFFSTEQKTIINWASPKQVIVLFKDIGINVDADNVSGESIADDILKSQKNKFEIIPIFMEYQTIKKDFTTYGEKFLKHIHPKTNRIHSTFNQLMITARLSSNNPNLQNLPNNQRTKSCFVAEENNVLIDADYTAQEDILFTQLSQEKKMIEFYNTKGRDGHSYVAKLCFPKELKNIKEEDVKSWSEKEKSEGRRDLRFEAKSAKFSIHYGGTPNAMSRSLNLPIELAQDIFTAYLTAFPDIKKYLDTVKRKANRLGYITTSPVTNRKVWCKNFKQLKREKDNKTLYRFTKLSANYPIQTSGAETIKMSLIYFFRWILKNNYFNIVKISGIIHDEILCEGPEKIKNEVANNLQECMERAGSIFCKDVKLYAKPCITTHWHH